MANATSLTVAGGVIDPAFPNRDIYLETPVSAPVPPGRACKVAAQYVQFINRGDYMGAAALFHDDATFLEPMRPSLKGRAQIDQFYATTIAPMKPHIVAVAYTGDDNQCMVALANRTEIDGTPRYYLASVDHFIIRSDGKVDSMVAFARPG